MKMILSSLKNRIGLFTLILLLPGLTNIKAQTQIYFQNFNSGAASEWTLNSAAVGGSTSTGTNYWLIGNAYAGNALANATPDEPAAVIGNPESYYMHITNGANNGFLTDYNANFEAPATGLQVASMNTPIVTTGYTGVTLSFWYLCNGKANKYYGVLYYSLDNGTTWVQEGGTTTYSLISSWTQATITDVAWNNAASLEFAFVWDQAGGNAGNDPPFAIDDVKLVGTSGSSCPLSITNQASTNPTCNGSTDGTITITATGGSTINYTINSGTPVTNTTGIFTGLAPGTYSISVADTCSATGTNIIISNPTAVPAPTASNTGPYCTGGTLQLNASTVTNATYTWTGPNSFSTQNPGKTNITLSDSGTYTVIAHVGTCSSAAATTRVIITTAPTAPVAGNNGPVCAGSTLNLTATTVAGATYSWTGPNNFSSQNPSITNATTADSGTYSVIATIGSCSSTAATTTAVVHAAPPTPVASNNGPACAGGSIQLSTGTVAGASYAWTGPNNFSTQNPTINNVTSADTGTYTIIVTLNGCSSASATTHVVVVSALPTPTVSNNGPLCSGSTLNLTANSVNGASYAWTGPNNFSTQNPSITNATVADSGTYTVIASLGGCSSAPAQTTVIIAPAPTAPAVNNNGPLCAGDSLVLTAAFITGATYAWTGPNNFSTQNPGLANVSTADAGTYSVIASIGTCSSQASSTNVVIHPAATAPTVTTSDTLICSSDSATVCTQGTYTAYAWNNGATTQCFTTSSADNYYVTITDANGCTARSSNSVSVGNFVPTPITLSITGDTLTSNAASHYQWYLNGQAIAGDTTQTIIAAVSGNYYVQVTDVHGCSYSSAATNVVISGIDNLIQNNQITVYPNPLSSGNWHVNVAQNLVGSECEIYDANGRVVYRGELNNTQSEILMDIAAGVYVMQIHSASVNYTSKLVKMY